MVNGNQDREQEGFDINALLGTPTAQQPERPSLKRQLTQIGERGIGIVTEQIPEFLRGLPGAIQEGLQPVDIPLGGSVFQRSVGAVGGELGQRLGLTPEGPAAPLEAAPAVPVVGEEPAAVTPVTTPAARAGVTQFGEETVADEDLSRTPTIPVSVLQDTLERFGSEGVLSLIEEERIRQIPGESERRQQVTQGILERLTRKGFGPAGVARLGRGPFAQTFANLSSIRGTLQSIAERRLQGKEASEAVARQTELLKAVSGQQLDTAKARKFLTESAKLEQEIEDLKQKPLFDRLEQVGKIQERREKLAGDIGKQMIESGQFQLVGEEGFDPQAGLNFMESLQVVFESLGLTDQSDRLEQGITGLKQQLGVNQ